MNDDRNVQNAPNTQGDTQIGDTRIDDTAGRQGRLTDVATGETANTERGTVPPSRPSSQSRGETGFLPADRMTDLRTSWDDVQAGFVDDPRAAVQKAQGLVESIVDELTSTFSKERETLESQWNGGNVDTEALRVALQRYRAFFNRLLST